MLKLGITYLYTIMKYGYPPNTDGDLQSFDEIRKMGFHYLEMEGLGKKHAQSVLNNLSSYKKALLDSGIHIHNFCIVDPDLTSLDHGKRRAAFDNFRRMVEAGVSLGAETLHLASYAPPVRYSGRRPYQLDSGGYEFGGSATVKIPDGFCWDKVWENLVDSVRKCAEIAKEYEKTVLMEPRIGEIICSVDSMIRLLDDVGMDNLKANFDTAHFSAQREDVCLALMKLEGRFANIHIADNRPENTDHIAVGEGSTDWYEFFRLLKRMRYDGYLGLDLGGNENLVQDLLKSRDFIAAVAKETGCILTW